MEWRNAAVPLQSRGRRSLCHDNQPEWQCLSEVLQLLRGRMRLLRITDPPNVPRARPTQVRVEDVLSPTLPRELPGGSRA